MMATEAPPDLEVLIFSQVHYLDYQKAIAEFEKRHDVRVQIHTVNNRALQSRLQASLMSGSRMPDLVEIEIVMFGALTQGPLDGVGFYDLTDRIIEDGLMEEFVESRFGIWSRDGRIFGLPHDMHPVMLSYRADILEELGIDPEELTTWDKFVEVARNHIVKDLTGNGIIDRYAIDFSLAGTQELVDVLFTQRGLQLFDKYGQPGFNRPETVDLIAWYVQQIEGENRISFPAGWGQNLAKAFSEGLITFLITPDWRTRQVQMDMPRLAGNVKLMPLPAWEEGGVRTTSWGGSALVMPKTGGANNPDLAWELAKFLYLEKEFLPDRFLNTNIIPPTRSAWEEPFMDTVNEFWGQPIGRMFADLAEDVPAVYASPFREYTRLRLSTVVTRTIQWVKNNPGREPHTFIASELDAAEADVLRRLERNVFQ